MTDKNQIEPGDLAIIIKSMDNISIGKIVECISMIQLTPLLLKQILLKEQSRTDWLNFIFRYALNHGVF